MTTAPRRVLVKLSGEALGNTSGQGVDVAALRAVGETVARAVQAGYEVALVAGGGNFLRGGREAALSGLVGRSTADQMGMLATMMNGLALRDTLTALGLEVQLFAAKGIDGVLACADSHQARDSLSRGRVVIFSGGTGNPFVTTDSAASLRAVEIQADALLKATGVDGIYDKDPKQDATACHYPELSFAEVLRHEWGVMDLGAFVQCRDFALPICVFNVNSNNAIVQALQGRSRCTWVQ